MIFIYNFSIRILTLLFWVGRFFNKKIEAGYSGRLNWNEKIKLFKAKNRGKIIWFHCASLGEFEMARPVIEELNKIENDKPSIILTFFSPSGFEIRKNYNGVNGVFYLPFDTFKNAEYFIEILKPDVAVFVKYEFWLNYLFCLKRQGIKTILINAIFNNEQIYFKWYGKIYLEALENFDHIFVQNKQSKKVIGKYGINDVTVSGDLRYDRVIANSKAEKEFPLIEKFVQNSYVIVGGSTWQPEEEILKYCLTKNETKIKLIIAPHDVSEKHLEKIENLFAGIDTTRFSQNKLNENTKVLIIDSVGHLSTIYKYGNAALVGGGFSDALHNIIEPAVYGIPVFYGFKFSKFPEGLYFKRSKIGFAIHNGFNFNEHIKDFIENRQLAIEVKQRSASVFRQNTGSTMQVFYKIAGLCDLKINN